MVFSRFKLGPAAPGEGGGGASPTRGRPDFTGGDAAAGHGGGVSGGRIESTGGARWVDADLRGRPGGRLNLLLSCASWRDDTWADRLPCLLEPMGISAVRAMTARHAERVIRSTPIHIAIVDLGLPLDEACDAGATAAGVEGEAGTRVLDLLARLTDPVPTVIIQAPRSQRDGRRTMAAALNCGAFAVVDRAAADLEFMLGVMRRCLDRHYGSRWPTPGDVV
ncbi:MAG: hypothetical protein ACKVS8_03530 [Phycisphaerales bacterium]